LRRVRCGPRSGRAKFQQGQVRLYRFLSLLDGLVVCLIGAVLFPFGTSAVRRLPSDLALQTVVWPSPVKAVASILQESGAGTSLDSEHAITSRASQDEETHAISLAPTRSDEPVAASAAPSSTPVISPVSPGAPLIAETALQAASSTPNPPLQADQLETLKVTSNAEIRNGPSDSATLIGTATPGAQLQVKSRNGDWIQFTDPMSGNGGWIESRRVGYAKELQTSEPSQQAPLTVKKTRQLTKRRLPASRNTRIERKANQYATLPSDQEFLPRRGFGLFWRRRMPEEAGP
jgi:hypothetical protein